MKAFPEFSKRGKYWISPNKQKIYVFWGDKGRSYYINSKQMGSFIWTRQFLIEKGCEIITENKARQLLGAKFLNRLPAKFPKYYEEDTEVPF